MEEEIIRLIKECKQGDISSFEKLVKTYSGRVSNIIYQMLGSSEEVDDLSQEVFLKIYRNINYFREESQFFTWLYRVTVNTVYDFLRKQKYRKTVPLDEIGQIPSATQPDNSELKRLLHKEISGIPFKYRAVIILKDIEGFSYSEISKILRCRLGTVESRLFRARQMLKENLQKTDWWRDFL